VQNTVKQQHLSMGRWTSCFTPAIQWCSRSPKGPQQQQQQQQQQKQDPQQLKKPPAVQNFDPSSPLVRELAVDSCTTTTEGEDTPSIAVQLGPLELRLVSRRASCYYGDNRTSNFQQDSTGVFPWWGGIILASWLSTKASKELLLNKKCIELGCGAYALPSLVAGARGACVSATDGCDVSLNVVRRCLAINVFANPDPEVRCLSWTDSLTSADSKQWDVVLFADVLYKTGSADILAHIVDELLVDKDHGLVVGTMGLRRGGGASLDIFEAMRKRGFVARGLEIDEEVVQHAQAAAVKLDQESSFDTMGSTNWSTDLKRNECRMVQWTRSSLLKWEDQSQMLYDEAKSAREANIGEERAKQTTKGKSGEEWMPTE